MKTRDVVLAAGASHRHDSVMSQHVLILDDDTPVLRVLKLMVEDLGHTCTLMENGQEALEDAERLAAEHSAALLDLSLEPGGPDGVEVLDALRSHRPELPVLILSGWGEDELGDLLGRSNVSILHKPFTPTQLAEALTPLFAAP